MATGTPHSAQAQSAVSPKKIRHRLFKVAPPVVTDGCSGRAWLRGVALNDCGVVTGIVTDNIATTSCNIEPFIWSFCENPYPPGADERRNLANLAGEEDFKGSGLDVSNAGVVVGRFGDDEGEQLQSPWVWDLTSYTSGTDELDSTFLIGAGE